MDRTIAIARNAHEEEPITTFNGFLALVTGLGLLLLSGYLFYDALSAARIVRGGVSVGGLVTSIAVFVAAILVLVSLYTLQPNEAAIMQLFGAYRGTTRTPGLRAANPFYTRKKISLRSRNLNGERLKVNDKRGNPIEIAAVVVWRVDDTAKAFFDIDNYENYVKLQAEAAVRHLASSFAYDDAEGGESDGSTAPTLLASADIVVKALVRELGARFEKAGVTVEEARLTHLAYAPEIAQVMLRRQQAEAIIAARTKIVHGAVSMVQMALTELSERKVVELDDERRATMVNNLLTVLCAESEVQPVVNTGSLYT
ncbi:MAG: SPFH domain-containing protein [Pseudomonadota bacterium]|nr:SPFH domain-containing protein [Pseudomonadota bacterium]